MKRNILIVEQDPALCDGLRSAFLLSGCHAYATGRTTEVLDMISGGERSGRPFDLVIVDISERTHRGLVAKMLDRHVNLPIFTVKDSADKTLIIEMLKQKRMDLIERFIDAYPKA